LRDYRGTLPPTKHVAPEHAAIPWPIGWGRVCAGPRLGTRNRQRTNTDKDELFRRLNAADAELRAALLDDAPALEQPP
jgi:hypothetical protein